MVALDPHPIPAQHQLLDLIEGQLFKVLCGLGVVETVAEADDALRIKVLYHLRQPVQSVFRFIRWKHMAGAARNPLRFSKVQVRDHDYALIRPV